MALRFGIGYDAHTFGARRALVLGGVEIPHDSGLRGHSAGDAVAHAVIDALLGAAAMGDIGRLFPDTDERWRGADSMKLLAEVVRRLAEANCRPGNVDVTVITEAPKLAPHIDRMRERMARAIGMPVGGMSIKAKTNEKMDSVGEGRGLQVFAIASLEVA
jgi:2-C-methyl-D-erythritol 2,4-cyclodiphosphate synthase